MNKLLKTATALVALCFIDVTGGQAQTDTDRATIEAGRDIVRQEHARTAQQQARENAVARIAEDLAAHAQPVSEPTPSARRVFLLCRQEDPQCIPLIQKANEAFLEHPHLIYGNTFFQCAVTRENQNTLDITYARFMQQVEHDPSVGQWRAWQVVYLTYSMFGGPCSP